MSAKKREADLKTIAWMIGYHIDPNDWYSDYENIKTYQYMVTRDDEFGDIQAYVLWTDTGAFIRGLRSGTIIAARGRGLASGLYRRLGRLARRRGKLYKTYCSLDNVPSLNAHFKGGMKIEKVVPYVGGFISVHLTT